MTTLQKTIKNCSDSQLDALWAILKYKQYGILRKVQAMCAVLNIEEGLITPELPQDENGWLIDSDTRYHIHDFLIERAGKNEHVNA